MIYDIEKTSAKNNEASGITGILTYKVSTFMQFLEGPELSLQRLFAKIKKDPRHTNIDLLRKKYIHDRQFKHWHMKYIPIDSVNMKDDTLYDKLFKQGSMDNDAIDLAIESRAMIEAFKQANYYR
jgi:hypothetical protein